MIRESETEELERYVAGAAMISSEVSKVEVPRAAYLKTGVSEAIAQAEAVLRRLYLLALDDDLYRAAARARPPRLRSLDALHIAAAMTVRDKIEAVVAYDRRLGQAAREAGLQVVAPGGASG